MTDRDLRLDVLRGIGLLAVILAHVSPPAIIHQLRTFDVPLMVLVAGAAFARSGSHHRGYFSYVGGRFIRLAGPTWLFLAFLFGATFLFFKGLGKVYPFTAKEIISSFLFLQGIGYVWVVRVFLLVAAIAPFVISMKRFLKNPLLYYIALCVMYAAYEAAAYLFPSAPMDCSFSLVRDALIYYLVPYGCVFAVGVAISPDNRKEMLILSSFFFTLFGVMAVVFYFSGGAFVPSQLYKYPPRIYYISYGLFASLALYAAVSTPALYRYFPVRFLAFAGRSTMWSYLWHIVFILFTGWLPKMVHGVALSWYTPVHRGPSLHVCRCPCPKKSRRYHSHPPAGQGHTKDNLDPSFRLASSFPWGITRIRQTINSSLTKTGAGIILWKPESEQSGSSVNP